VENNGTRLIVTCTSESIIGIDANSGKFYWQAPLTMEYKNNANTPQYYNGCIFGIGDQEKPTSGMLCLQLSPDGKSVTEKWRNQELTSLMGGYIIRDGFIYGSKISKKSWYCLDCNTGAVKSVLKKLTDGAMIYADGLFYCYGQDGMLTLLDANPTTFTILSSFKIKKGTDQHWSHPVIYNGIIYLRHGNALMAYSIRSSK
jgi:outer membrane protein assembly factor BamB